MILYYIILWLSYDSTRILLVILLEFYLLVRYLRYNCEMQLYNN